MFSRSTQYRRVTVRRTDIQ